jgi:hypothetical protein
MEEEKRRKERKKREKRRKKASVSREAHDSSDKTAFYLYDELVKSP